MSLRQYLSDYLSDYLFRDREKTQGGEQTQDREQIQGGEQKLRHAPHQSTQNPPHRSTQKRSPCGRSRPWVRQCVLNVGLVCLAGSAVFGKQLLMHFSLFTVVMDCKSPIVTNLRLTDLYMTGTGAGLKALKIEWKGDPGASVSVQGAHGGTGVSLNDSQGYGVYVDTFDAQSGTKYIYSVSQTDPPPPPPPYPYVACHPTLSDPVTINVTPIQAVVAENQSVDARYDPRYATWTYLDHKFGTTTYRGGLSAGYNADNSKVGHAYLKFALPAVPAGQALWPSVGSVNGYYLRSYDNGSTVIACQSVPATWSGSTIVWTTAPSFAPASATSPQQAAVSYDGTAAGAGWTHWTMAGDIVTAAGGSGAYAAALGGFNEPSTATNPIGGSSTGWAYFSKKEYVQGQPACVLYAYSQ